jgi:hypothetical protein
LNLHQVTRCGAAKDDALGEREGVWDGCAVHRRWPARCHLRNMPDVARVPPQGVVPEPHWINPGQNTAWHHISSRVRTSAPPGWEMILLRRQGVPPSPSGWNRSPRRRPWFRVVIGPMTQQEAGT